eukprot:tig00021312_g20093.t1
MPAPVGSSQRRKIPVYLNVYDLAKINEYTSTIGLGIFHSGVEVLGKEYSFGGHEYSFTGVFDVPPRHAPQAIFRESVLMGECDKSPMEVKQIIERLAQEYPGNTYSLVARNCNHFANDLCSKLVGKGIPGYINRLANWGMFFNCVLPEGWGVIQTPTGIARPPTANAAANTPTNQGRVLGAAPRPVVASSPSGHSTATAGSSSLKEHSDAPQTPLLASNSSSAQSLRGSTSSAGPGSQAENTDPSGTTTQAGEKGGNTLSERRERLALAAMQRRQLIDASGPGAVVEGRA